MNSTHDDQHGHDDRGEAAASADGADDADDAATEVALVMGAGGLLAQAWHAGVLRALQAVAGWDARSAELIVGTSAGAVSGLALRAGISPSDLYAHQVGEPCSREGQRIIDRAADKHSEDEDSSGGEASEGVSAWMPQSPRLAARALWPPWRMRPVHAAVGLLPAGCRSNQTIERQLAEVLPEPWPERRFWVPAVRLSDGRRVVFGRDDVRADVALAIRASSAVPAFYGPVAVGSHRYVDGSLHSATNADLTAPLAFDAVVVSSVMSGDAGWSKVTAGLRDAWSEVRDGVHSVMDGAGVWLSQSTARSEISGSGAGAGDGSGAGERREASEAGGPGAVRREPGEAGRGRTAWVRGACSRAWNDGQVRRAALRRRMADRLRDEVDGLRRMGVPVLVVEPGAAAVELIDSYRARVGPAGSDTGSAADGPGRGADLAGGGAPGGSGADRQRRVQPGAQGRVDRELAAEIAGLAEEATRNQLISLRNEDIAAVLRRAAAQGAAV